MVRVAAVAAGAGSQQITSAGRSRLPPPSMMYSPTWRTSTTSECRRARITASTARMSSAIRRWTGSRVAVGIWMGEEIDGRASGCTGKDTIGAGGQPAAPRWPGLGLTLPVSVCILRCFSRSLPYRSTMRARDGQEGEVHHVRSHQNRRQAIPRRSGEKLKIESIAADVGAEIVLDQVLLVADGDNVKMGTPLVSGASVKATVVSHGRGEKIKIFKMRRRKHYRKHQGHRQNYTEIEINGITARRTVS